MTSGLAAKLEVMNFQRSKGSFLTQVNKRISEFDWALGISDKTTFMRVIPSLVILASNKTQMHNTAQRVKRLWESKGAAMQEERIIQNVMFLASLPLGYYNIKNFTEQLDRYFIVPVENVVRMLPVQTDFSGNYPPAIPLFGRKGQLIGLDIHDRRATNRNMLISAAPGSGKSVITQYILLCEYRRRHKVRIIDIGHSYRKLTRLLEGTYLDIAANFVVNPFSVLNNLHEEQDKAAIAEELENIRAIIAQMCYANGGGQPDEIEYNLISEAVQWAYSQRDYDNGVTLVAHYLSTYPEHAPIKNDSALEEVVRKSHVLAYIMRDFVAGGQYAEYVHGQSTVDIDRDDWLVLELDGLTNRPALFNVVILIIINMITRSLYLKKDKDRVPTFILFEEAWKFLNNIGSESTMVAKIIEEGFRKARKYFGSFAIVTQSINDTRGFGAAGEVIRSSTQFKFLLRDSSYNLAKEYGIIDYSDFEMMLLESVSSQLPRYSEVFIDGGEAFGRGVCRLSLDDFTYGMTTSDATDNRVIFEMIEQGMSYEEAIREFSKVA